MNEIINYFSTIPSSHRAIILASGIAIFWMIESALPFVKFSYNKWQHARINIFFTITTLVVNFCLALILLKAASWSETNHFGILQWFPAMNIYLFTLIGLMLLDLVGAYIPHFIQHEAKFLWRFHFVHHTDTWIDTTSANRHHPFESIIRFLFTTIGVLVIGCPIWLVFMYQSLSIVFSQFNHANIILPKKVDQLMSYFIVSPDMHKVHHHYVLPYTDSNYGNIFSVWDRIFGTFTTLERTKIIYGIDTHMDPKENNALGNLIKIPFQKKRAPKI